MKIIESFVLGKQGRADRCEDGWVVTDAYAAVVDGSTSKLPPAEAAQRPKSGGRQAMEITLEAIRRLPPQATKDEALSLLTAALRREMPPGALERAERRLTCSAVVYSAARREVWMVGDCQCRFGGRTYTHPKAVDAVLTRIRCDVIAYLGKDRQDADRLGVHPLEGYTDHGAGILNHKIIRAAGEDIIFNSFGKDAICLSDELYAALIKGMRENYAFIYKSESTGITARQSEQMAKAVGEAYEFAIDDLKGGKGVLDKIYFPYIYANLDFVRAYRLDDKDRPERVAADFIASMCDDYFLSFYNRYIGRLELKKTDYFD